MTYAEALDIARRILTSAEDAGWIMNTTEGPVGIHDLADLLTSIAGYEVEEACEEEDRLTPHPRRSDDGRH